jgi:chromate transport protein ChrA
VRSAIASEASRILDAALVEKIVLITLVAICFGQVLPGVQATNFQFAIGVPVIVLVNTALSHWLARRGFGWAFSLWQFIALAVVNLIGLLVYAFLRTRFDDPVSVLNIFFFVLLLTLLITLYDRYRQVYLMRFSPGV